ncbi:MAG: helix-turn-helix domain-containing protein [Solirubrobacterales bacterium]
MVDPHGLVFILSDDSNSQVGFTGADADLLAGRWVRGTHAVTFNVADQGSGIRRERLSVDGSQRWSWEHIGDCATSFSQTNGEWARSYQPCPVGGPLGRAVPLDTAILADGAHALDSHASRLRRKLHRAGVRGAVINVWGVGYRLWDTTGPGVVAAPGSAA